MARIFPGSFTQHDALPAEAVAAVLGVPRTGRLHRHDLARGELGEGAALEAENRDRQGNARCLAVTSGGQAPQIAMRAAGIAQGIVMRTNCSTLAPAPGAIGAVGGKPLLVEIDENLRLDPNDLATRIDQSGARFPMLSHLRGHPCDTDRLMNLCARADVTVIEDRAHTMGTRWSRKRSVSFGKAACLSTRTCTPMNSGEGGFPTTDGADHAARAAYLRPRLTGLDRNIDRWNRRCRIIERALQDDDRIAVIDRPEAETFVGPSIQFRRPNFSSEHCLALLRVAAEFSLIRDVLPGAIRSLDADDAPVAAIRDHILHG